MKKKYNLETILSNDDFKIYANESNGCGSKGGIKVPNSLLFVSIIEACNIHDIEWFLAKDKYDLINANQRFRRNMERIIDAESNNKFTLYLRTRIMHYYYDAVKFIGTDSYAEERGFIDNVF